MKRLAIVSWAPRFSVCRSWPVSLSNPLCLLESCTPVGCATSTSACLFAPGQEPSLSSPALLDIELREMGMQRSYDKAVVVVTGASTGLGRAIAVGAAEQGAQVVVINFARSPDEAETTATLVREAGAEAVMVQGDVGLDEDCLRIAAAAEAYGRIDALFNNAGITRAATYSKLDRLSADDFLDLYRVNVVGAFQMVRAARVL